MVQNAHRSFRATSRKRQKSIRGRSRRRSATRTGSTSAPGRPGTASGPVSERSRAVLTRPGAVLERPGASQERSWAVPGASWTVPGATWPRPGASPNRPEAPRRLQDRFWIDFCSIFRRFWVDFSSIFAFRVRLFRCFRRAGAARRVACAVAAASDKALTSWGLRLPPCSAASPVPGVRAFSRTAVLARSHAPRATCRTPRSPPCSAPSTALYSAAADVLRIAERCRQAPVLPRAALPAQLYRVAVDVRRIAERFFQLAGARSSTARSHCDGDAMKRY